MAFPTRREWVLTAMAAALAGAGVCAAASPAAQPRSFEVLTRRMDVDVDGAPRAYGPRHLATLDTLADAHYRRRFWGPVVGYMTRHGRAIVQGPQDPAPGYYVSQTTFEDESRAEIDPRRYVDATRINYVVWGDAARRHGVKLGDFVAVYSRSTGRSAYGIVGDDGNPSGDEGSLHLLQALGYPFHDGRKESVERRGEIVIRYFPGSNPRGEFFHSQAELDQAAVKHRLSRDFTAFRASK